MYEIKECHKCSVCGREFVLKSSLKIHEVSHGRRDGQHECVECGRRFTLKSSLQTHVLKHTPLVPYDCPQCGIIIREKDKFMQHMASHDIEIQNAKNREKKKKYRTKMPKYNPKTLKVTKSKLYPNCDFCRKEFSSQSELKNHLDHANSCKPKAVRCIKCKFEFPSEDELKCHVSQQLYVCDICDTSFTSCADKKYHVARLHELKECDLCKRKFSSAESLSKHKLTHTESQECSVCDKKMKNLRALMDHIYRVHSHDKKAPCNICGKMYMKCCLRSHMETHVEKRDYTCRDCGMIFKRPNSLALHMKTHSNPVKLECDVCGKHFPTKKYLRCHKEVHTTETECPLCHKKQRNQKCLKYHMRQMHSDSVNCKAQCDICGEMFHKNYLKTHISIHLGEKNYTCSVCGKKFAARVNLWNHTKVHTGQKKFKCELCDKLLCSRNGLKIHLRIHKGEKPFQCDLCPFAFIRISQLRDHIKTHSREKNFSCQVCGKKFAHKKNIKPHYSTHTQEELARLDPAILSSINRFNCYICEKTFYQKALLRIHQRIHKGEKPHKCLLCGKSFSFKVSLNHHMKIHNGEHPYECSECGKNFTYRVSVKKHMNLHSQEKALLCNLCGKAFAFRYKLEAHQVMHSEAVLQPDQTLYRCSACNEEFSTESKYLEHRESCLCETIECSQIDLREDFNSCHISEAYTVENYDAREKIDMPRPESSCEVHTIVCSDQLSIEGDIASRTPVIFKLSENGDIVEEGILVHEVSHSF